MSDVKDLLEAVAAHVPRSLDAFVRILSGPKRFLQDLPMASRTTLPNALTFACLSFSLAFLLEVPFLESASDLWSAFAVSLIFLVIATVVGAAVWKLSFRIVGGRASFRDHLVLSLYVTGPFSVLWSLMSAAPKGLVRIAAPTLYPLFKRFMDASLTGVDFVNGIGQFVPLFESKPVLVALATAYLLICVDTVWLVLCWGAFRHLNRTTRLRSGVALFISLILSLPMNAIVLLAQRGLGVNLY
jgi:hypothetical protein